jgi:hypothetical protein
MIKRLSIFGILYLICLFSYGQRIVSVDDFEPFERQGDTIYYNRNNYEFVVSHHTKEAYYNNVKLFYLYNLNDYSNKTGFYPFSIKFKNKKLRFRQMDFDCELCLTEGWHVPGKAELKDFKIKKNDMAYYLEERAVLFPEMPKDSNIQQLYIPIHLFPELEPIFKKFYDYLNFENDQKYSLHFDWKGSMNTEVEVPILCNPEINGTGTRYNQYELKHILDSLLMHVKWPLLKVEKSVLSYTTISFQIGLSDYVGEKLQKMRYNKNLKPLLNSSDSLLTFVDSINYFTTVFILGKDDKVDPTAYSLTVPGIIDYNRPLADINNDGRDDYVLDTLVSHNYDGVTCIISYIPNYAETNHYEYSLSQSIDFTGALGNHFYYWVKNNREASIFYIKNNTKTEVISITENNFDAKLKIHPDQLFQHFSMFKNDDLTVTYPSNSKKAGKIHQVLEDKIKYYVEHPEKLPVDFQLN